MRSFRSVRHHLALPSLVASILLLTVGACRTSSSRVVLGRASAGPAFDAADSFDATALGPARCIGAEGDSGGR